MERTTTAARLNELMKERHLTQRDIIELTKPYIEVSKTTINKANMSMYVSGKVAPAQDKLYLLGRALNVSEAWLMGFDVPKERPERNEPPIAPYYELETIAKDMDPGQLSRLLEYAKMLKQYKGD